MAEIRIAVRKDSIEDLPPHEVVLHIALAVPPGERTILILMEPHHDAGTVDVVVVDRRRLHVPADFALGVIDRV